MFDIFARVRHWKKEFNYRAFIEFQGRDPERRSLNHMVGLLIPPMQKAAKTHNYKFTFDEPSIIFWNTNTLQLASSRMRQNRNIESSASVAFKFQSLRDENTVIAGIISILNSYSFHNVSFIVDGSPETRIGYQAPYCLSYHFRNVDFIKSWADPAFAFASRSIAQAELKAMHRPGGKPAQPVRVSEGLRLG